MTVPPLSATLDAPRTNGSAESLNFDGGPTDGLGFDLLDPVESCREQLLPEVAKAIPTAKARRMSRSEVARLVTDVVIDSLDSTGQVLDLLQQRRLVSVLIGDLVAGRAQQSLEQSRAAPEPVADTVPEHHRLIDPLAVQESAPQPAARWGGLETSLEEAKRQVKPLVLERIDVGLASSLDPQTLHSELRDVVSDICKELRLQLNSTEFAKLVSSLVDDMIGLGPLEPLLADDSVTDIMVNGHDQVYVERSGKLQLTDVVFQDDGHVMNIATRIVTRIGRRIDESSPICDARLLDGSRVNIIVPPLAIDGPSISIRKFSRRRITLDKMAEQGNLSSAMCQFLKIAARCRLNVLISGGTGSGKTTLLNALSQLIDHGERVVTIEDAAELQLQQPHVVRLETRPASLEGKGEINIRHLVKNALRMRPDRIIVGEVRGGEAVDMLQAMNTGHDGSMCTVHANRPRDALIRLENMVGMASVNLPAKAVRTQIASAIHLIIQISRMRDGMRRINTISEVCGMEGDVVITQDLFTFEFQGEDDRGRLRGAFRPSGVRPHFMPRAEYFGLGQTLMGLM